MTKTGTAGAAHSSSSSEPDDVIASISIALTRVTAVSMIRIFNYNKSRTHSYRGVKRLRIKLDEAVIFSGEIKKAAGLLNSADAASEVILFTRDDTILARIANHDEAAGDVMARDW